MSSIRHHHNSITILLFLFGLTILHFQGKNTFQNRALKPLYNDSPTSSLDGSSHSLISERSDSSYPKMDETQLQPSCRRVCNNQYQNVILLTRLGQAGLGDRVYIYLSILQLAGYLCAQVWVPSPKLVLTPRHNKDQELSINVSWIDLSDFQFVHQPAINYASIKGKYDNSLTTEKYTSPLVEWKNEHDINQLPDPKDVLDNPRYQGWLYVNTSKVVDIINDFERVEQLSWNIEEANNTQAGFIWQISANYYKWKHIIAKYMLDRRISTTTVPPWLSTDVASYKASNSRNHNQWQIMQPYIISKLQFDGNLSEGCMYSTLNPPTHVQELIDKLWNYAMNLGSHLVAYASNSTDGTTSMLSPKRELENSVSFLMGYFHIRRNDATKDCDTTLECIDRYLNCSFDTLATSLWSSGMYERNKSLVIVVFFASDESDPQYRQAVVQSVNKQTDRLRYATGANVSVIGIDTDKLVNQLLDEEIQQGKAPDWRRNNFYVYETIYFLNQNRAMIRFKLEKRRAFNCPNCTNIAEQILEM